MTTLTGCNYDVNEELQPLTDQQLQDDADFEAWLAWLEPGNDERGASRPPMNVFSRIAFKAKHGYSVDKIGFLTPEEQIREMKRLDASTRKRHAAKARSIKRQRWSERGSMCGAFVLAVIVLVGYAALIGYGIAHPEAAEAQTAPPAGGDTHHAAGKCGILFGKPACAGREHETSRQPKKPKVTHLVCSDQLYSIGPAGCSDIDEGTDTDGQPIAPRCKLVMKCKRVNGPDPTVWLAVN